MQFFRYMTKTIRRKLSAAFLILIILPMVFSNILTMVVFQKIYEDKVNTHQMNNLSQIAMGVERIFKDLTITADILILDHEISEILNKEGTYQQKNIMLNSKYIEMRLSVLEAYSDTILAIEDQKGQVYSSNRSSLYDQNDDLHSFFNKASEKRFITHDLYSDMDYAEEKYLLLKKDYSDFVWGNKQGQICIGVAVDEFIHLWSYLENNNGSDFYIVDSQGRIVISSHFDELDQEFPYQLGFIDHYSIHQQRLEEDNAYIYSLALDVADFYLVQVIEEELLFQEMLTVLILLLVLNGCFIILFLIVSNLFASNISDPIKKLSAASKEVAEGHFIKLDNQGEDEVAILTKNFNNMTDQLENLIVQINEDEKAKRQLELKMLYAQINPHFLFNTLNSIRWMAETSKVFNISRMIVALSNLLKSSIITTDEFVTIEEEMNNIKNYLTIQKYRFMALFTCQINIEEELKQHEILKLILQPIVENAVIHGFEGIDYKGIINIRVWRQKDEIRIRVEDNGKGICEQNLKKILEDDQNHEKSRFSGIGMANVDQRLKLHYGKQYGLKVESEMGLGTCIDIIFPFKEIASRGEG
ncbi:cache domain-containing sensor histidine kinase [Vallitalea okinawensis]|uniref:cache domain-containing sensor histidine kinase n=1 Tax=Vallitalea okinawensis TaxID=2078660 RepID=UPI000CFE28FB|nr:sensor histidine kinase [Vallitalea okinawensis]